ncbi:Inherit from COG: Retrotransposon protein [Seminavis robusta]|uniref:Inherit from COG: Retrotransposon protein n=1 Tax=Seminavis robusta TaxID=568900 RepID=A0A9N8HZ35_9STRA|nr:Inherit from COG: Retrotransposon protein [Seminavis robusta]|eukprot:Sro3227_g345610.1 Inherit from COG: Retrotransposon protein (379) ;mRNA; f:3277-4515
MHHPDDGMEESFLEHPTFDSEGQNPFNFSVLAEYQAASAALQQTVVDNPERFFKKKFGNSELICFCQNDEDKIVLTKELLPKLVSFYHKSMAHVEGMDRLEQTIKTHFYHRGTRDEVRKQIEQCKACAKNKRARRAYGESAPRDATAMPWQEVHCDTIGPWTIELRQRTLTFNAMTMVDPCTNLLEIVPIMRRTSEEGARVVEDTWFARYPRPKKVVTDNGPEFKLEFIKMVKKNGAVHRYSTPRNPQVLRTIVVSHDPKSVADGIKVISETLATAMHAHRCSVQSTNAYLTPGALAFKRDMFLDIPIYADIMAVSYDYAVDNLVYKRAYLGLSDKLKPTASGPYRVSRVHTNGNVTIQLSPHQFEHLNIRRVFPKHI